MKLPSLQGRIPSLEELEVVWPDVQMDIQNEADNAMDNVVKETLIQSKMREQAITALITDGKLTEEGKLTSAGNVKMG